MSNSPRVPVIMAMIPDGDQAPALGSTLVVEGTLIGTLIWHKASVAFIRPPLEWAYAFYWAAVWSRLESYPAESEKMDDDRADCLHYCIVAAEQWSGFRKKVCWICL